MYFGVVPVYTTRHEYDGRSRVPPSVHCGVRNVRKAWVLANKLKNWLLLFVFLRLWTPRWLGRSVAIFTLGNTTSTKAQNKGEFLMAYGCLARNQHLCHRAHRVKCMLCWLFSRHSAMSVRFFLFSSSFVRSPYPNSGSRFTFFGGDERHTHATIQRHTNTQKPNPKAMCWPSFFVALFGFQNFYTFFVSFCFFVRCTFSFRFLFFFISSFWEGKGSGVRIAIGSI